MGGPKKALQRERDGPHSKALTGIAQKKKKPVPTSAISYPCTGGGGNQSTNLKELCDKKQQTMSIIAKTEEPISKHVSIKVDVQIL